MGTSDSQPVVRGTGGSLDLGGAALRDRALGLWNGTRPQVQCQRVELQDTRWCLRTLFAVGTGSEVF